EQLAVGTEVRGDGYRSRRRRGAHHTVSRSEAPDDLNPDLHAVLGVLVPVDGHVVTISAKFRMLPDESPGSVEEPLNLPSDAPRAGALSCRREQLLRDDRGLHPVELLTTVARCGHSRSFVAPPRIGGPFGSVERGVRYPIKSATAMRPTATGKITVKRA